MARIKLPKKALVKSGGQNLRALQQKAAAGRRRTLHANKPADQQKIYRAAIPEGPKRGRAATAATVARRRGMLPGAEGAANPRGQTSVFSQTASPSGWASGVAQGQTLGGQQGMWQSSRRAADAISGTAPLTGFGGEQVTSFFRGDDGKVGGIGKAAMGAHDYFMGHGWGAGLARGAAAYAAVNTAGRLASGGGLLHDRNGNFNVIGLPLI
jgi:hypothetical protein